MVSGRQPPVPGPSVIGACASGAGACRSRYQLVLDLSRAEVVDYLYQAVSAVLESGSLEYVKWDMNRHLTDVYSAALPAGRQGRYPTGMCWGFTGCWNG